jgi:hypothetical protein
MLEIYRRFGGTYCLHLLDFTLNMEAACAFEMLIYIYISNYMHHSRQVKSRPHDLFDILLAGTL